MKSTSRARIPAFDIRRGIGTNNDTLYNPARPGYGHRAPLFCEDAMRLMFTVPGPVVGKGRPRVSTIAGHARMYTPAKTLPTRDWSPRSPRRPWLASRSSMARCASSCSSAAPCRHRGARRSAHGPGRRADPQHQARRRQRASRRSAMASTAWSGVTTCSARMGRGASVTTQCPA